MTTQCGVCFGCVLRRASFAAAWLTDTTAYADPGRSDDLAKWLDHNSILGDMRRFVRRGVTLRDVLSMCMQDSYSHNDARSLCGRGAEELREFVS